MRATKPKDGISTKAERLANRVIKLKQRKDAGFSQTEAEISAMEFEGLMLLEQITAGYEVGIKKLPAEVLKAAFGVQGG